MLFHFYFTSFIVKICIFCFSSSSSFFDLPRVFTCIWSSVIKLMPGFLVVFFLESQRNKVLEFKFRVVCSYCICTYYLCTYPRFVSHVTFTRFTSSQGGRFCGVSWWADLYNFGPVLITYNMIITSHPTTVTDFMDML